MPVKTKTHVPVFPTDAEFAEAAGAMRTPIEAVLHLSRQIVGVAHFKGERTPTFADIGKVFAFTVEMDARMSELGGYLETIRANLTELDYVRELENRSDDPEERMDRLEARGAVAERVAALTTERASHER